MSTPLPDQSPFAGPAMGHGPAAFECGFALECGGTGDRSSTAPCPLPPMTCLPELYCLPALGAEPPIPGDCHFNNLTRACTGQGSLLADIPPHPLHSPDCFFSAESADALWSSPMGESMGFLSADGPPPSSASIASDGHTTPAAEEELLLRGLAPGAGIDIVDGRLHSGQPAPGQAPAASPAGFPCDGDIYLLQHHHHVMHHHAHHPPEPPSPHPDAHHPPGHAYDAPPSHGYSSTDGPLACHVVNTPIFCPTPGADAHHHHLLVHHHHPRAPVPGAPPMAGPLANADPLAEGGWLAPPATALSESSSPASDFQSHLVPFTSGEEDPPTSGSSSSSSLLHDPDCEHALQPAGALADEGPGSSGEGSIVEPGCSPQPHHRHHRHQHQHHHHHHLLHFHHHASGPHGRHHHLVHHHQHPDLPGHHRHHHHHHVLLHHHHHHHHLLHRHSPGPELGAPPPAGPSPSSDDPAALPDLSAWPHPAPVLSPASSEPALPGPPGPGEPGFDLPPSPAAPHWHSLDCGHELVFHDDHFDFLIDGTLYHADLDRLTACSGGLPGGAAGGPGAGQLCAGTLAPGSASPQLLFPRSPATPMDVDTSASAGRGPRLHLPAAGAAHGATVQPVDLVPAGCECDDGDDPASAPPDGPCGSPLPPPINLHSTASTSKGDQRLIRALGVLGRAAALGPDALRAALTCSKCQAPRVRSVRPSVPAIDCSPASGASSSSSVVPGALVSSPAGQKKAGKAGAAASRRRPGDPRASLPPAAAAAAVVCQLPAASSPAGRWSCGLRGPVVLAGCGPATAAGSTGGGGAPLAPGRGTSVLSPPGPSGECVVVCATGPCPLLPDSKDPGPGAVPCEEPDCPVVVPVHGSRTLISTESCRQVDCPQAGGQSGGDSHVSDPMAGPPAGQAAAATTTTTCVVTSTLVSSCRRRRPAGRSKTLDPGAGSAAVAEAKSAAASARAVSTRRSRARSETPTPTGMSDAEEAAQQQEQEERRRAVLDLLKVKYQKSFITSSPVYILKGISVHSSRGLGAALRALASERPAGRRKRGPASPPANATTTIRSASLDDLAGLDDDQVARLAEQLAPEWCLLVGADAESLTEAELRDLLAEVDGAPFPALRPWRCAGRRRLHVGIDPLSAMCRDPANSDVASLAASLECTSLSAPLGEHHLVPGHLLTELLGVFRARARRVVEQRRLDSEQSRKARNVACCARFRSRQKRRAESLERQAHDAVNTCLVLEASLKELQAEREDLLRRLGMPPDAVIGHLLEAAERQPGTKAAPPLPKDESGPGG
ncbi:hypothetical protein H696_01171 [Fonticula alba]|uniref:BZIP domain-containing protein n=1 Tax=Fonticula alba TaxID=691883 RepID=A0A058ZBH2_FONAL|nr:hypothetical protein, variant [Fonticula alba]XP_009493328.1 hypothetical protein H696_01171 [Fonticula alba]KCV71749.1 hypothetical protein H696_01171 [Fonticula alba]KCV71750.1 hypothetical protein, variant [Fonticula alba]|eukprot:XP_009493327.1 hypothetical protein, variant [Fonticula alba]